MLQPEVVLFDLDGTLTDPLQGIAASIEYALQQLQVPVPEKTALRSWVGPPLLLSFETYLAEFGEQQQAGLAIDLYRRRFSTVGLFENQVYPGIAELLMALVKTGRRLYLATAKPTVYARRIMQHFALEGFFAELYGSELDGRLSDKTELLDYLLRREKLAATHCLMIGDRKHDIVGALNNGVDAVGVAWGYGTETELLQAGASHIAFKPEHLAAHLNCL